MGQFYIFLFIIKFFYPRRCFQDRAAYKSILTTNKGSLKFAKKNIDLFWQSPEMKIFKEFFFIQNFISDDIGIYMFE